VFSFALSEEERLVQETARRFAQDRLRPGLRAHESARAVPQALADEFAALGFDGAGAFARALALEELAAVDPGAAIALDAAGLAHALVPERGVVIHDDAGAIAVRDGRVSGTCAWVSADAVALAVILHPGRALVVREGWRLEHVRPCGLEATGASRIVFADAPVAATIDDARALARASSCMRTAVAALLTGAARGAHEYAMRYATERIAFGRPIAHHQALAFLIADLATAVDVARLAVWRAAAALDRGEDATWEAASAVAEAVRTRCRSSAATAS
jgi:alkylation response protein AidB-like acyl-CoA dehydrogenase